MHFKAPPSAFKQVKPEPATAQHTKTSDVVNVLTYNANNQFVSGQLLNISSIVNECELEIAPLRVFCMLRKRRLRQNLMQRLKEILLHEMSEEEVHRILDCVKGTQDGLTIKQYRHNILKNCHSVHPLPKVSIEKLVRQIDTALCQSLTPQLKKILEESAVHFADTNWCNGIQDLHFCFAVNPGTGELELWEAHANGTHLMALDQNYWLFNQKWEFLTMPEDLIPDDSSYLS